MVKINFHRSQAAIDFVMTYGWAIMMVMVAIGALAYFGVLSPDKLLPEKCTFPSGIACLDSYAESAVLEVGVTLKNSLGYDVTGVSVIASGCTTPALLAKFSNGQQYTFAPQECNIVSGQKYSGQFNITFTNSETGITHKFQGRMTMKVS